MTKFKEFAKGLKSSFFEAMRVLTTLVKMQLKEKMDMSYLRSTRRLIFKIVWLLAEFAAITAVLFVVFYLLKLLSIFSLVHDVPISVVSLVFAVMLLLSVITDTAGLMKALYFSKDNTVLLTFPATPSLVFLSKLATYYVYEIRKSFMFTIPMFIAFGIVKGYAFYYYPWLVLMFLLISVVPVLLSALLSIPSMVVYIFLSKVKVLQYTLYAGAAVGGIFALRFLIRLIPADINLPGTWGTTFWEIQDFLGAYVKNFRWLYYFTELIVGRTVGLKNIIFHAGTLPTLGILILLAAVLFALCFLVSKPLFYKMASTPFEFKKKNSIKEKNNNPCTPFVSAIKKELIIGLRSNCFIKLFGILVVIMPMSIELLNRIYSAIDTKTLGASMAVSFNVVIMMLITMMTNIDIGSVYSRDGSSSYLNKVQPAPYSVLLLSKLVFPMAITFVGTAFSVVIFAGYSTLPIIETVMLGIAVYAFYITHLFASAESDIMNPQYEQYATFSEQSNNPNETKAAISSIIISAIVFIVSLLLSSSSGVWTKLAAVSLAIAAFKIVTYLMKIKIFYKEKV